MDLRADFLVIGSGIAGLRAALTLAESGDVVVLTKADPRESNTGYAQGGIAAALGRLEAWDAAVRAARQPGAAYREFMRVRSIVRVGLMIARAAVRREESRGGHFRSDFPNRDDIEWRKHVADRLGAA